MKTTNNFKSTIMAILTMAILTIMAASMTSCDKTEMDDITPNREHCWECIATATATTGGYYTTEWHQIGVDSIPWYFPGTTTIWGWEIRPIMESYEVWNQGSTVIENSPAYIICGQTKNEIDELINDAYTNQTIGETHIETITKCEKQ